MPSTKKTSRRTTGKALVFGQKPKQPAASSSFSATKPGPQGLPDGFSLGNSNPTVPATCERSALMKFAGNSSSFASAPVSKPVFKLFILGPVTTDSLVAFDSPAVLDLLDLVRKRCAVQIDHDVPFPNSLTVYGNSFYSARAAHESICHLMHNVGSASQQQVFMVQPSDDPHREIILANDANSLGWTRFSLAEDPRSMRDSEGAEHLSLLHLRAKVFRLHFAELASELQAAPSNVHMQVYLGKLLLYTEHDRAASVSHTAKELNALLAELSAKNSVVFDRRIGGRGVFDAFQQQVFHAKDDFYPCSSTITELTDVQPQRFLVIVTGSFRVELEIGPPGSAPDGRSARLSHLRVFQMLGTGGRVGMTAACPNRHLDWKLEAVPELKPDEIPSTIKAFLAGLAVVYSSERADFPLPIVRAGLIKAHRVKQMFGKTAWTVGCKGTRYMLELALYHKFPKSGTADVRQMSTSVSISNSSWEETLKRPSTIGGLRDLGGESWDKLFTPGTIGDGIVDFLSIVYRILVLWDGIHPHNKATAKTEAALDTATRHNRPLISEDQRTDTVEALSDLHNTPTPPDQAEEDLIMFD